MAGRGAVNDPDRRGGVGLLIPHAQVPGVNAAPLTQEVADRCGAAVVHHGGRLVDEPVPELGDETLDGQFVDGGVIRDAGHHVPEGDDFAQLR
jgi:hypothetical protein